MYDLYLSLVRIGEQKYTKGKIMTLTYIKGKDWALEQSIDFFTQKIQQFGIEIKIESKLNPVPNVYSTHIKAINVPRLFSNGKGSSEKASLASAYGEFLERLTSHYFFNDFYLGLADKKTNFKHYPDEIRITAAEFGAKKELLLTPKLWKFYDPANEISARELIEPQFYADDEITALPFVKYSKKSTHEKVYFPVAVIGNLYASNGIACGNTLVEARVQAMSEILERFVKNQILTHNYAMPEIPAEVIASYPQIEQAIAKLCQYGFTLKCFDCSLGGDFPVISIVLFNPKNCGAYASFGAHPRFEIALERTLTELLQGRALNQLNEFSMPSFDQDEVADLSNLETHFIDSSGILSWDMFNSEKDFEFYPWFKRQFTDTQAEFDSLLEAFKALDSDVYIYDMDSLEVKSTRVIVPKISEIYPCSDLFETSGNWLFQIISKLDLTNHKSLKNKIKQILAQLAELDDSILFSDFVGIVGAPNSLLENIRLGELKGLFNLYLTDFNEAFYYFDWAKNLRNTDNSAWTQTILLIHTMLELELSERDFNQYSEILTTIFGSKLVKQTHQLVFAQNLSWLEQLLDLSYHQKITDAYQKILSVIEPTR